MIPKHVGFVFELFSKRSKVAKIDQNGKGLAFTFCSILAIFSTFKKRFKEA